MTPTPLLLLVAAAVGVDTGWTPLETGGYEYIIQIPAEQLESLRAGGEFASDFPSDTGAIRSFKIVIGDGPLLNQGKDLPEDARVTFKQVVDDPASGWVPPRGASSRPGGGRDDREIESTANAVRDYQFAPIDATNAPRRNGVASQPTGERPKVLDNLPHPPGDGDLSDPDFLSKPNAHGGLTQESASAKRSRLGRQADNATAVNAEKAPTDDDNAEGPSPVDKDKSAKANEPEAWSRSQFQWTLLVLGLIFCGGLNGYLGWLAMDFRNRYLELLRDLDTSAAAEPEYSSGANPGYEDDERAPEPHAARRELVRAAETHVGRRDGRRRHDREADDLDDE